jgi:bleomycin hydrolase
LLLQKDLISTIQFIWKPVKMHIKTLAILIDYQLFNSLIKRWIMIKNITLLLTLSGFMACSISVAQETDPPVNEGFRFTTLKTIPASPVKDQYKSGTCWSFAATSFVESELLRLGYDTLDISEMFFVNHAYRDKANRYVRLHGSANFGPGGQAHDVLNVVKQYGFITEAEYPGLLKGEPKHKHGELDAVLKAYLDAVIKNQDGKLSLVWPDACNSLLDVYMGPLPESPDPEKIQSEKLYPRFKPEDYVELTSYAHHPFYTFFDLEIPDNWSHDHYFNLPAGELYAVAEYAIKNGFSVCWDGDVSDKGFSHSNGVAIVPDKDLKASEGTERLLWEKLTEKEKNAELYNFKNPGKEKEISQEMRQEAFDNYQASDDHLMHLTGLVSDQNGNNYFITKNSWAANSNSTGGYLNMSKAYFMLNTIAIMIHKDAIPDAIRRKLKI